MYSSDCIVVLVCALRGNKFRRCVYYSSEEEHCPKEDICRPSSLMHS